MTVQVHVLVYRIGVREPEVVLIDDTLDAMQAIVGGSIEGWQIAPRLMLICHSDGMYSCPLNRFVQRLGAVHGDFFILRHDHEGESISITEADVVIAKEQVLMRD